MNDTNNNGRVPIKIVQLLMEKMELGLKNSQEKINSEINELIKVLVTITTKLGFMSDKVDKMVLVIKVVFSMLALSVLLAGFGSHFLYKRNSEILTKEIVKRIEIKKYIDRKDIKDIIKDYVDKLKEGNNETAD